MEQKSTIGHTSSQHWHDLPYKDKVAHVTAVASFFLGWIIAFIGLFLPPMGEIDPTVIGVFGIAISYCGAMYGIINYVKSGQSEFYNQVMSEIQEVIVNAKNK